MGQVSWGSVRQRNRQLQSNRGSVSLLQQTMVNRLHHHLLTGNTKVAHDAASGVVTQSTASADATATSSSTRRIAVPAVVAAAAAIWGSTRARPSRRLAPTAWDESVLLCQCPGVVTKANVRPWNQQSPRDGLQKGDGFEPSKSGGRDAGTLCKAFCYQSQQLGRPGGG